MTRGTRNRATRRSLRRWTFVIVVLLALAVVERTVDSVRARRLETWPASWIWAPVKGRTVRDEVAPEAFYAVRDFELEAQPDEATLSIAVDEEYQLFVNGRRVGSGSFGAEGALDSYAVTDLLVRGRNRLVIEARSRIGFGGLIALLVVAGSDQPLLVTDHRWRVVRIHERGILSGLVMPEGWVSPTVYERSRIGRWGAIGAAERRPRLDTVHVTKQASSIEKVTWQSSIDGDTSSREVTRRGTLIDFGEDVTGFLELWLEGEAPRRTEELPSVTYSMEKPGLGERAEILGLERDGAPVVSMKERPFWRDAMPRRFRYVYVRGDRPVDFARVERLSSEELDRAWQGKATAVTGVFGLAVE